MTGTAEILIVDKTPEHAEEINSLLRNAGINVHVHCVSDHSEAEQSILATKPLLLICNVDAFECIPAAKLFDLTQAHDVMTAVRHHPEDTQLSEALEFSGCIAINAAHDSQLIETVNMLLGKEWSHSELETTRARLEELESRYHLLLDSSKEATAYLHEGLHVYANPSYLELLQADDFAAIETLSLMELASADAQDLKQLLREMGQGNFPRSSIAVELQPPGGTPFPAELDFSPARLDGEDCIQMRVRQKDAQAQLKDELARLRSTDLLTRLSNRPHFIASLEQFMSSGSDTGQECAVLYLEPDNAGEVQSRLGIRGFDAIVSALADVVRENTGEEELAARFSDHGFAMLAIRDSARELKELGERLIKQFPAVAAEFGQEPGGTTCSSGLTIIGNQTRSAEEAISQARSAFLEASRNGNALALWKPPVIEKSEDADDGGWAEKIRYALNNSEFYSVQQSVANLEGESEGLFESRTFMRDEAHDIAAETYLPFAERCDLGAAIDRHVIPGLMKAIAGSGDRHIINVSANSTLDFSFPSWLQHQLRELGVEGSQLILQVSAQTATQHLKPCARLMEELRASGCDFSISEFDDRRRHGELLESLQVQWVKLRSGVAPGLANNSAHQAIVRNVVSAAEKAKAQVIADEVQDAADLAVLWQCGVKMVSGEFLKESPQVVGQ